MFFSKPFKFLVVFPFLLCQACGFWQNSENKNADAASKPFAAGKLKTEIPFASKEPDVYQAEIVLTDYASGEKTERKIFTARRGAALRCDYENKISFLQSGDGARFSINSGKKIYTENSTNSANRDGNGETIKEFLTAEWLSEKRGATFENRGAENGLTKYLARLEDAPNKDSEVLIYVDENLKIPVRQEFYATSGGQKILVFSMELRNVKLEADDKLFELPKDYRKVSASEFQKTIRQESP